MITIIISKLHFFQVQRKLFLRYAVKFYQSLFGITPKTFEPVNIHFAGDKFLSMIDSQMSVTTEHQGIIASEFVGINNRTTTNSFDSHIQQRPCRYIFDNLDLNNPISLINAKYRYFTGSTASTLTLASAAKIGLIKLYFTSEKLLAIMSRCKDRVADNIISFQGGRVTYFTLNSRPKGAYFQLEKFYQPQPCFQRASKFIYPSVSKVMEGIFTLLATVFFTFNSIDFSALATRAKNSRFFVALFPKVQSCRILGFNEFFKGFYVHLHHCNNYYLVQNLL